MMSFFAATEGEKDTRNYHFLAAVYTVKESLQNRVRV